MKIDWNAGEKVRARAIKISEMKEKGYTYAPLRDFFGLSRNYIIALKQYGDKLRQEKADAYWDAQRKGEDEEQK